jgi:hypothetical protein
MKREKTMIQQMKVRHGTPAWFDMVGAVMRDAATAAGLPSDFSVSLVERYSDGIELSPGLFQGLRFEIVNGAPSFRHGARLDEHGDVTVTVSMAGSLTLNTLYGDDPRFPAAFARLRASGELTVDGDLSRLGSWFDGVHDRIVDRTA